MNAQKHATFFFFFGRLDRDIRTRVEYNVQIEFYEFSSWHENTKMRYTGILSDTFIGSARIHPTNSIENEEIEWK